MTRILHFADAHIDIATNGRHDAQTGLSVRMQDFLKSMDTIVDTAIAEKVDMVLFAGDAYKDRTPVPTFQREWGRRIVRLSQAGIPTLLLVGNHDLSPALGRAHAMQEFETLPVPHVQVASKPRFFSSHDLENLPIQIMALPWVSRSGLMAVQSAQAQPPAQDVVKVYDELENRLHDLMEVWFNEQVDDRFPVILAAHASVQGATYGGERAVMLGADLVLSGSLVKDPRLSYTALGHIHKAQDLNKGIQPPVIYPGSIERVDFGEAHDDKFFVIADVQKGRDTQVEWHKLNGRRFVDCTLRATAPEDLTAGLLDALPPQDQLNEAVVRLVVEYQVEWEPLLDERVIREYAKDAFEFHLVRRPQREARIRLPNNQTISSLTAFDLLDVYWRSLNAAQSDADELQSLARQVIGTVSGMSNEEAEA